MRKQRVEREAHASKRSGGVLLQLKGGFPLSSSHITFPFFSSPAGLHGVTSACKFDKG